MIIDYRPVFFYVFSGLVSDRAAEKSQQFNRSGCEGQSDHSTGMVDRSMQGLVYSSS
jgi:hypothetical protein